MLGDWISYWVIPLFSALVWLVMLLTLLLHWITVGKPIYPSMQEGQTIAFISDTGAYSYKPVFIALGAISVVSFDIAFIAEQYLRGTGRLLKNNTRTQKILAWLSIFFAVVGAAGLILLAVFDTYRHPTMHNIFLSLFIGGYVFSAVFTCAEYQRLGARNREDEHRILRVSFWIKLAFILIEVALAVAFGTLNRLKKWNDAGIVEWVIALVYTFYVASFALDFRPATRTARAKRHEDIHSQLMESNLAMAQSHTAPGNHDVEARATDGPGAYYPSGTTSASGQNSVSNGAHKENGRSFV